MLIEYKNNQIRKLCEDSGFAQKKLGELRAEKLDQRLGEIRAADSVEQMIQFRIGGCHQLRHDRKGQYAVNLDQPYRLVFEQKANMIQIVRIIEIVDYH